VKASLGRRLPCEASLSWRVVYVLLGIVFLVASAVPLVGQEPSATQSPGKRRPVDQPPYNQPQPHDNQPQPPYNQPQPPHHNQPQPPYNQPQPHHNQPQPPYNQPQPPYNQPQPPYDQPSIKPTETEGGDHGGLSARDWGIIIFGTPVAISVVAFIVRWLKRDKEKENDRRPPPKIDVAPVKDYGEQHVAPRPPALAVELCPVLDPGDQALDKVGPLIEQRGGQWTSNLQR